MKKITIIIIAVVLIVLSYSTVNNYNRTKANSTNNSTANNGITQGASKGFDLQQNSEKVQAKDFTLTDLDGKNLTLSDLKGKKVFLNFWATWCPPCRGEMPEIEKIYQETKDSDLVIVAVELGEPLDTVKAFIDDKGYNFKVLLDKDQSVGAMYNITAIPTSYFIDKDGNMIEQRTGAMTYDEMKQAISKLDD